MTRNKSRFYVGNVYLGQSVPDVGKHGLDQLSEVRGIRDEIIKDANKGIIDPTLAMKRMNFLKLVSMRDTDFQEPKKKQSAINIVESGKSRLRQMFK